MSRRTPADILSMAIPNIAIPGDKLQVDVRVVSWLLSCQVREGIFYSGETKILHKNKQVMISQSTAQYLHHDSECSSKYGALYSLMSIDRTKNYNQWKLHCLNGNMGYQTNAGFSCRSTNLTPREAHFVASRTLIFYK